MKNDIHPDYHPVVFQDSGTGGAFLTRSTITSDRTVTWTDGNTYPLVVVDVTNESHPFWTGAARVMDTQGRVEKFERKYGKAGGRPISDGKAGGRPTSDGKAGGRPTSDGKAGGRPISHGKRAR